MGPPSIQMRDGGTRRGPANPWTIRVEARILPMKAGRHRAGAGSEALENMKGVALIVGGVAAILSGLLCGVVFLRELLQAEPPTVADVLTYRWPYLQLARHAGLVLASGFCFLVGFGVCSDGIESLRGSKGKKE